MVSSSTSASMPARSKAAERAKAWSDMRGLSTGGTYINFLTEEEVGNRIQDAYGKNFQRLVDAKTEWDPDNFFRVNKNIPPRGGAHRLPDR